MNLIKKQFGYVLTTILLILNILLILRNYTINRKVIEASELLQTHKVSYSNIRSSIKKYYEKSESLLSADIGDSLSNVLIFSVWRNSCGSCAEEQLRIIRENYETLLESGINVRVVFDQKINIDKYGIPDEMVLSPVWFPLLGKVRSTESTYFYWLENNSANHIFYPVSQTRFLTIDYFEFIKANYGF